MADELERPLTLAEAAQRSGRHHSTIKRWSCSGQLKLCAPPIDRKRGKYCTIEELEKACTIRQVKFKRPREPHLARKREIDLKRKHEKYIGTEKYKAYNVAYGKHRWALRRKGRKKKETT